MSFDTSAFSDALQYVVQQFFDYLPIMMLVLAPILALSAAFKGGIGFLRTLFADLLSAFSSR